MTIPGRFLLQKLLRDAVNAGCTHAVIEMSSEGAVQFRQRFVDMNALIFTHLTPEHIESHGSLEKYINAKLDIGRTLARSTKRPRIMVGKGDDPVTKRFFALPVDARIPFSLRDGAPYTLGEHSSRFMFEGVRITAPLLGQFNVENMLAAAMCGKAVGISAQGIKKGLEHLSTIPGRMEEISEGQSFRVFVDYAHTKESLDAVYGATKAPRICVLGNTGGGRDRWKRPLMARTAELACAHVILTNEDPYDEEPMDILCEMSAGMEKPPEIILDRSEAIRAACVRAAQTPGSTVLITGKGTDPYIMEAGGKKTPWDDREKTRAILRDLGYARR
jgi:UDP-N-acetylmuramoyl-L-alanyl-D-glutamate--2,6-diaminopimelate ligase